MTFPAILEATGSQWSGLAALLAGILLAAAGAKLLNVAVCSCAVVFITELFLV